MRLMNVLLKRKENLENHLLNENDLLKEYEDSLRLEDDPGRKAAFLAKIEEIKARIQTYELELGDISHRLRRSETGTTSENLQLISTSAESVTFGSTNLAQYIRENNL